MQNTPLMPDACIDIAAMSIEQIQAELAAYRPGTAAEVIAIEEHMARRVRLWRRLDELSGVRKPATAVKK